MPYSDNKRYDGMTGSTGALIERRRTARRTNYDRRSGRERRHDYRLSHDSAAHPFRRWIQSIIHPRIGIDRRRGRDRRQQNDRRQLKLTSILTREELADLLS
ncbi:MAG: hypothetical protein PHI97_01255 [Desulfobulbus sp.]|nr:hypothetical protein [Desulfobulbus sp.]